MSASEGTLPALNTSLLSCEREGGERPRVRSTRPKAVEAKSNFNPTL
jgi:hypothetical protein